MSADGGGTQFVYPTGKTPEQLYQTLRTLIDRLNQVKSQDATDLTAINAAIAQTQADLQQVIDDLASWDPEGGLTPQQAFELSLVTAVDTMMGSVSNAVLESIRQSEKAAEATIRAILAGLTNKGEIRVEQVVRKTENESFVSQLSTFEADLGNAQAAISNEIIARTNGDSALASDISTLTTTVNGNTAQILILASSVDGIEGRFGVAVNLNGQVVGLVQLDGSVSGSEFTVVATNFKYAHPDLSGGAPQPFLTFSEGNMYLGGDLYAQKIAAGVVTTAHLNAGELVAPLLRNEASTSYWNLDTGDFQIG